MKALRPLLLVVAGCAVYANSLGVPFVFDDGHAIVTNLRIRALWPGPLGSARPLVELTLALNYALHGLAPLGYHVVNLTLHLACALVLFDLARRTLALTGASPARATTVAWWAALLFTVHPLQTEAVTYVIGRSEVLMALCYLATLDLFLVAEVHARARAALWSAAVVTCAAGMAAKPVMVTAPLAAIWLARCVLVWPQAARLSFASERRRDAGAEQPPARWPIYVGLVTTWSVLAYLIVSRETSGAGFDIDVSPLAYLRTELGVTWHYFRLVLWASGQTLDYDWPLANRWLEPLVIIPGVGWLALLGIVAWLFRRRHRAAAFWLGFSLLALLPSSSLVPIADLVFEHRMYLSVAGFAVLAAIAGSAAAERAPRLVLLLACAVVVALGAATIRRNELWRDPVALWEDTLAKAPTKQRVYRSLQYAHERRGDRAAAARVAAAEVVALEGLRRARPGDPGVLTGLGNAYARLGRLDEGLAVIAEALRSAPEDAVARAAYGGTLLQLGRTEEAVVQLEIAQALVESQTGWVDRDVLRSVRTDLGWAYAGVGRSDDAVRILRLAAADGDVAAQNNLGSILGRLGHWEEARRVLEGARALDPADPNVASNLGWVYANLGQLDAATALLEEAILRRPGEASAHGNLGWVRLRAGDADRAVHALTMAQTLEPDNAWVANVLGIAYARLGEWGPAVQAMERATRLAPEQALARDNLARVLRREVPPLDGAAP